MFNIDGGRLPTAEDFLPKPDYRRPRYSDTPEFKQRFSNLGSDELRTHALYLIQMSLGVDGCDLLNAVANLLDEHAEYEVRLGIHKPCFFNAG